MKPFYKKHILKLRKDFRRLKAIIDKQAIIANLVPGDLENLCTYETELFLACQSELIKVGQEKWVLDKLSL